MPEWAVCALEEILKIDGEAVILMVTAYATFETAIPAWQRGAFNCLRKPFDNADVLKLVAAGIRRRRKDEERRTPAKHAQVGRRNHRAQRAHARVLDLVAQVSARLHDDSHPG